MSVTCHLICYNISVDEKRLVAKEKQKLHKEYILIIYLKLNMFSVISIHIKGPHKSRVISTIEIALRLYSQEHSYAYRHTVLFVWKSTRLGDSPLETLFLFSRENVTLVPLIW